MKWSDVRTTEDLYHYWNIPYLRDKSGDRVEESHLMITDSGYINYLNDESIFYSSDYPMEEIFNFGEIIIEFSNSLKDAKKIIALFEKFSKKYSLPTESFVKECYKSFRELGYSDLVTRCIVNGTLYQLGKVNSFKNFNFREYFVYWVFVSPLDIISQKHYTPTAFTKVEFWEDSDGVIQLCYSEFENYSLQTLDAIYARKNNVKFHKCLHCKGYFIEKNGNNKKFCPNCRNIHNDKKTDVFGCAYRTAYKTMQQRAYRYREQINSNYNEYYTQYIEPFINEAKQEMDIYRKNDDLDGYIKFLDYLKNKHKPYKERK